MKVEEILKKVDGYTYDDIMSSAKKLYEKQSKWEDPYAFHHAFEHALFRIEKLNLEEK